MLRNLFLFTCGLFLSANNFAHAQGNGASLLAKVDQYSAYNDIWGYTAPDGREYAIVGTTSGTAFYNCTDPTAPYRVGYISGPNSTWRDMKTYSHYAYIVTEGGGGVQIVNLQNPENPTLVKTWGTNHWTNAHNIAIDVADAKAYVCGTNGGLKVLNLSNPETPTIWATRSSPYIHDLHVQNGLAHFAEIYDGRYRITNVATNFPTRDRITTPGQFTHSTWANANDSVCVTTDEVNGGSLGLYDISDPTNIQHLDTWSPNLNSIVHNAFIVGDLVYASWYTEGLVVADISDPSNVTFHASYDTSSYGSGSGFHGAWGCYPFSPSGVIYVSDIEEGFHIVKVDGPAFDLDHTPVANTTNETGPYVVDAEIRSLKAGASLAQADVWYRTNGSAWA
ncbi:MAG: choice-of-anchor B family protein, partial [Planctomycetes bacterium]|nr:choice-of-anchor B family protein [Planctomycetota bacterium]